MFELIPSKHFKKTFKRLSKDQRFQSVRPQKILTSLKNGKPLEVHYRNHKLIGEFEGCFECHIQSNVLLIYQIDEKHRVVYLLKIGSHSELFG